MEQDHSNIVDGYLAARFGIGLDQVLSAATAGRSVVLGEALRIACERSSALRHPDGGILETFRGMFTLDGCRYAFACAVYIDQDGARFVSDLSAFAPVDWSARLPLPVDRASR